MDSELRWESSLWGNQQNGIEESLVVSDNNSNACVGKHMDLIPPEDALAAELALINGLMGDFGMTNQSQPMNVLTPTRSLDSIDCLLSATNSNADITASVEDDGISMIFFADYDNLWNFGTSGASGSVVSSSGEPENNRSNKKKITNIVTNKEVQYWHDESVSSVQHDKKVTEKSPNSLKRTKAGAGSGYSYFDLDCCNNSENPREPKKPRLSDKHAASSNINFQHPSSSVSSSGLEEPDPEAIAHMKEMIYRAAAFRPVNLGLEVEEKPRRKNVKISSDPQTVAARQRRERIGKRIRVLQKLVPGGSKMDTASMLDEAANYLKFLRSQVNAFENLSHKLNSTSLTFSSSALPLFNIHSFPMEAYFPTNLKPQQSSSSSSQKPQTNPNPIDLC